LKCVLVPTDFSKGAQLALERALLLPLADGATLHLVHVVPLEGSAKARKQVMADAGRALEAIIARAQDAARGRGLTFTAEVLAGT